MTEPSTSYVEQQVQQRIAAVKVRVQAAKQQRASLAEARKRGLARRHAAKLRRPAEAEEKAQQQRQATEHQDDDGPEAA